MKLLSALIISLLIVIASLKLISTSVNDHSESPVGQMDSHFLHLLKQITSEEFQQWKSWRLEHNREYASVNEELYRLSVWFSNMKYIEEHNRNADLHGFMLKMNSFGDQSAQEWSRFYSCHKLDSYSNISNHVIIYTPPSNLSEVPDAINWRARNAVTRVKDQEEYRCHSCYAFAAVGALESAHAIKNGTLIRLSEQQILDCSRAYANSACQGGNYKFAWNYIIDNGGIDKASYYSYKSSGGSCCYKAKYIGAKMKSFATIEQGNESEMKTAVGLSGPIAVTIDHKRRSFQFYSSGIYQTTLCSSNPKNASHEMLIVGYGTNDNGKPYWIAKNSYGRNWGTKGYMRILRGGNTCGIANNPAIPIL